MRIPKIFQTMAFLGIFLWIMGGWAIAQSPIMPALEQEYMDAKSAIDAAQKMQGEKHAPEALQKGQDYLAVADSARQTKDAVKFTQASRLARAYAELAKAIAELRIEEEKLAKVQEELQKAKMEIDRLKKTP
jgi:hypothetical protein